MRTNAIIRIVLFSIAIFVLLGILGLGLGATTFMAVFDESRSSSEITNTPDQAEPASYIADASHIRELEIEWAAGSITIVPNGDLSDIRISETELSDEKYKMVCNQSGDSLTIQFCKESFRFPSFGISTDISKDLLIQVPSDWVCDSLEIDAASADLKITGLTIRELDFDGASGVCELSDCIVGTMDIDAASGNVSFSGSLDFLDFDGASADCVLLLTNHPERIDLDGMSGDLDITLPADCGFTAKIDGLSSGFTSDFETVLRNGCHIHGDGACRIDIDAMSGNVVIRRHSDEHHSEHPHHN